MRGTHLQLCLSLPDELNRHSRHRLTTVGTHITMPNAGTPQGSIIYPLVFNIRIIKIAKEHRELSSISHVIYADDITIWAAEGTPNQKQRKLQNAVNLVAKLAADSSVHQRNRKSLECTRNEIVTVNLY